VSSEIPRLGRPPVKRDRALATLTRKIISGRFEPGQRLPPRLELERILRVDTRTLEETIRQLRSDGFITTRPRGGTFVSAHPPHLSHVALTFPFSADLENSSFYRALRESARQLRGTGQRFSLFYDILNRRDIPDYQTLLGLVERHALAGVIFAAPPWGLLNELMRMSSGVPRVAIGSVAPESGIPWVVPDSGGLLPRAFESLAARGRRRVAVLFMASSGSPESAEREVCALAAAHGLETRKWWVQGTSAATAAWATPLVAGMLQGPERDRPDALVIMDDNLVPDASAGVLAAGRRAGVDLDVVAHANFPNVTPSAVPALRLGFNVPDVLDACLKTLQSRNDQRPPSQSLIPVVWENEI
jgi:DNA-binding LacI/PurR family transcriptional regulator